MVKRLALAVLLCICIREAFADSPPLISFAPFPSAVQRTYASARQGTPAGKADLVTPWPNDFPPSIIVRFETTFSSNLLRVYDISEAEMAPYKTIQGHIKDLQKILQQRPHRPPTARHPHKYGSPLPDYPPGQCRTPD